MEVEEQQKCFALPYIILNANQRANKKNKTGEAWEQGKGGGVGWRPGNDEKVNLGHRKWETMKWRGKEWRSGGVEE